MAQFYLVFAWNLNDAARCCLNLKVFEGSSTPEAALECGICWAVCATKCIEHARLLIATGQNGLGQCAVDGEPGEDECKGGSVDR
jgi:hypothetical protein